MKFIDNIEELEDVYGLPSDASLKKVTNIITPSYKTWIEKSSFCVISSVGLEGADASPRGDDGQVVKILNDNNLALPDWLGNQRIDTLRNIIQDGRVSLLFMVSGSNNVIRINGQAKVTMDSELKKYFIQKGRQPKTVILVQVKEVYFQCARALIRSKLWQSEDQSSGLPTPGSILKEITNGVFDGETYDSNLPDRYKTSLW